MCTCFEKENSVVFESGEGKPKCAEILKKKMRGQPPGPSMQCHVCKEKKRGDFFLKSEESLSPPTTVRGRGCRCYLLCPCVILTERPPLSSLEDSPVILLVVVVILTFRDDDYLYTLNNKTISAATPY